MSSTHGALRIIELTSARLCDEFSRMAGLPESAASAEAQDRVAFEAGLARIRLRQAAWQAADHPLPLAHVATLAKGLPGHVRVDLSSLPAATVFPAATGRIILNLLLLATDSLPNGGVVMLAGTVDDLLVRIAGPAAAWPAGLALCVVDETATHKALTEASSLQMAITALLAHGLGVRLSLLMPPATLNQPAILRLGG